MPRNAQTVWLQEFKGRHDSITPGATPELSRDLQNVKFRFGAISPRGGVINYLDIAATTLGPFIGLFHYPTMGGTNYTLRMNATALEYLITGTSTWTDITGVALTGNINVRPQATIIDDTFVFTNEGVDLPRKWDGPATASATVIGNGSTPPYCKAIESYLGFLMCGNISDDATFTDLFDGPRSIRYADDWDNDWAGCIGNEIVLNETPGALLAMKVLGKDLICYKTDAIIRVRWVGGKIRFTQEKLPFSDGIQSPLSLQVISDSAHIFLGNDEVIYLLSGNSVSAISQHQLSTLLTAVAVGNLPWARSYVDSLAQTYYLFYGATVSTTLDSFVSFNFRDKVFSSGVLSANLAAVVEHKPTSTSTEVLLASSGNIITQLDVLTSDLDVGVQSSKYYTTNWQGLQEEGYFHGARLMFKPQDAQSNAEPFVQGSLPPPA